MQKLVITIEYPEGDERSFRFWCASLLRNFAGFLSTARTLESGEKQFDYNLGKLSWEVKNA